MRLIDETYFGIRVLSGKINPGHVPIKSLLAFSLILPIIVSAQTWKDGSLTAVIKDKSSKEAIPDVNVVVCKPADSSVVTGNVSDKSGKVSIINIPAGSYFADFRMIGYRGFRTHVFVIDSTHRKLNLGTISLSEGEVNQEEVVISAQKYLMTTLVDRKVYNVEQDVVNKAGTASQILQNLPSVQVDLDGNVSLRGSSTVTFLVDGKPSPMLDQNSAEVLQQIPASSIEKIEVITNPSAKFKADGTAGIINLVMKKDSDAGLNGNIGANAGNDSRENANIRLNYNSGSYNIYGSYSIRQNERNRNNSDTRALTDSSTNVMTSYHQDALSHDRPISHFAQLGFGDHFTEADEFGGSGHFMYTLFTRTDSFRTILRDSNENIFNSFDRDRFDLNEYHKAYGFTAYYEHDFPGTDSKLRFDFNNSTAPEDEFNHYTNHYWLPQSPTTFDSTQVGQIENNNLVSLDYSNVYDDKSKLEIGYSSEFRKSTFNIYAATLDTVQKIFIENPLWTNRFTYDQAIHAAYITYQHSFGQLGALAGLRMEEAFTTDNIELRDTSFSNNYFNVYPSLHLSYKISDGASIQLNYSRRINRPDGEDLDPFPEYRDPRNPTVGNAHLQPEYIHSIELGIQFETDLFSFFPSLYYRHTANRMTSVTTFFSNDSSYTSRENLSSDESAGLELIAEMNIGHVITSNASTNAYYDKIDASNLGYGSNLSTVAWSGTWTTSIHASNSFVFQVNANFNSTRLTPQGEYRPSYVINIGARQELMDGRFALSATVADAFKTQRRQLELNTPYLDQTVISLRDAQVWFVGCTYFFSATKQKKESDDTWHYDDSGG